MNKIDFYRHELTAEDGEAIKRVLDTPFLTSGSVGRQVEQQLTVFFGVKHALLVNSWTNGALAVLLALGIGPGDEVIVPAMTFIASANMPELIGAKVVFADVDPDSLMLTPEAVSQLLTPRTRAIIPVHLYGQMCDIAGIRAALGGRTDVAIIEDCAHCFEGQRDGYRPGAHSDAAIFSFYATKNVTCGEGGAIVSNRDELMDAMRKTRLHGMSVGAIDRFKQGQYNHWDMDVLGVKANLPDLLAALLPRQIETIRERLPRRQALAERYHAAFANTPLRLPAPVPGGVNAWHLFTIHVPGSVRDRAIAALNQSGINVTVNYRSVPTLTYYRERYGYTPSDHPVSHDWGAGTISLPFFPAMTKDEQQSVIDAVLREVVPLAAKPNHT